MKKRKEVKKTNKTYELYSGLELKIAELIQQRRYQMIVHSCIYYHMNNTLITDRQWDQWARELVDLQNRYPEISRNVVFYEDFKDWDASSGAFLPISEPWVIEKAKYLYFLHVNSCSKIQKPRGCKLKSSILT